MPLNFANVAQALRPASLLTPSRMLLYAVASTVAVTVVVLSAFIHHNNFYSATVYLSRSNRSSLILANFALLVFFFCGKVMQHIFLGPLRPFEVEQLYDRTWIFFTESLLAFTIFRDEFDIAFGAMFALLLFVKCFHWLMQDRVEWMDTIPYPGADMLFHVRFISLFGFLWLVDAVMIAFAVESILTHGVGGIVLFGSEYAILLANAYQCLAKWAIFTYDQHRARRAGGEEAPVWENKTVYIFYVELVADFFKLLIYLSFFLLVMTFYGFPLNVIRDVYMTARSFYLKARQLMRYRAATKNMEERYPNATEADILELSDKTCIICREEMHSTASTEVQAAGPNLTPKKLPCGHIFHFHCLRSWLERQQSCPTCRRGVLETPPATTAPNNAPGRAQAPPAAEANPNAREEFFRRLVQMPPLVPGQIAHGPQEPGPAATGQPSTSSAQPQENLRPPAQFNDFGAEPDNEWQEWEQETDGHPEAAEPSNSNSSNDSASVGNNESSTPLESAREAAARAALRRFESTSSSSPSRVRLGQQGDGRFNPTSSTSPFGEKSQTPAAILANGSTPAASAMAAPTTRDRRSQPSGLPTLIPLFDPFAPGMRNARTTMASLPAGLTAEQLVQLDSITREAIDERLRVLEGVQTSLWRSAEELLKLKSVLPAPQGRSSSSSGVTQIPPERALDERGPDGRNEEGN